MGTRNFLVYFENYTELIEIIEKLADLSTVVLNLKNFT